ncbi:hypothetical protein HNP84_000528 [Thermocatellispora tengchongensis]|uniref:Uncharacterized protein n=1 Tax=Thermocatellispora tengchongensis TaxID=1073253 RepID=A0A840P075_9ACTN|nr:hypothetical protein [Thermocatellispora tengchongensis]MBB5130840.1 hypothetical protein [Thermocatellispora tengchongensis]
MRDRVASAVAADQRASLVTLPESRAGQEVPHERWPPGSRSGRGRGETVVADIADQSSTGQIPAGKLAMSASSRARRRQWWFFRRRDRRTGGVQHGQQHQGLGAGLPQVLGAQPGMDLLGPDLQVVDPAVALEGGADLRPSQPEGCDEGPGDACGIV